jgi:hypothetical protein
LYCIASKQRVGSSTLPGRLENLAKMDKKKKEAFIERLRGVLQV